MENTKLEIPEEPKQKYKVWRGYKNDKPFFVRADPKLQTVFNNALNRNKRNWDYVAIVAGIPGAGKSTFAMQGARYLDPNFDESKIAFNAEQFIKITNDAEPYSAVVLDESFHDLNSRSKMSYAFMEVVGHLQLLRQKRLYIFLCLPNFFDLSQDIAIFRASHLFYVYEYDNGMRGRFRFYDRNSKTRLYVMGKKFMNYDCVRGIFFGNFYDDEVVDEEKYLKMKEEHLKSQEKREKISKSSVYFAKVLNLITERKIFTMKELEDHTGCNASTLQSIKTRYLPST